MKKKITTLAIALATVVGLALPAAAHNPTHFHGGRLFINFHTETSTTAMDVNMVGCSQLGGLARRWENQRHYVRQNSTAPWQYSHEVIASGSWYIGNC